MGQRETVSCGRRPGHPVRGARSSIGQMGAVRVSDAGLQRACPPSEQPT
jgi:hypothetical protein